MTEPRVLAQALSRFSGELPRVVLIDGRSGSGKTSLATEVAGGLTQLGLTVTAAAVGPSEISAAATHEAQVLHVEDLYPGWDGLAAGASSVPRVLQNGGYQRFDWHVEAFVGWISLDPARPLVIEGCGALSRENIRAACAWANSDAVWSVWVQCTDDLRMQRAFQRDGEMFRPHWNRWAAQEVKRISSEHPIAHADQVLHTDELRDEKLSERLRTATF